MDPATIGSLGIFTVVLFLFLLILGLLWCMVPFILMGTNSRLSEIVRQNKQIIELLSHNRP